MEDEREQWIGFARAALAGLCADPEYDGALDAAAADFADRMVEKLRARDLKAAFDAESAKGPQAWVPPR